MPKEKENNPQPENGQANGDSTITARVVVLDEELAQKYAKSTEYQRRLSKRTIKKYAGLQTSGKWLKNYPAPFYVDKDGHLLDGAHRRDSVLLSKVPISVILVEGIDPKAIHAMDIGRPRTLVQMLELDAKNAPVQLASALKYLKSYREEGDFSSMGYAMADYFELLEQEPQLEIFAPRWVLKASLPRVSIGLFIVADYLISTIAGEDAYEFLKDCARGEALVEGDPAFAFRQWVLNLPPKRNATVVNRIAYALLWAWDKNRRGEQVTRFNAPKHCPDISPLATEV